MTVSSQRGVTLIELLISVTLVGLISVGVLMALRVGINAMDKTNTRLLSDRRVVGVHRIIERQVGNLIPVTALCGADASQPGRKEMFFQGEAQSMRFVSGYSLREAARGYPRILEYQVIPGERNLGVRLVVNELLYTGSASTGELCLGGSQGYRPIEVGPQSFVLADQLAYCRFAFLEREPRNPADADWVSTWRDDMYPAAIRIEMEPLNPDASRLPLLSLTLPLRISKQPLAPYPDEYVVR